MLNDSAGNLRNDKANIRLSTKERKRISARVSLSFCQPNTLNFLEICHLFALAVIATESKLLHSTTLFDILSGV